MCSYNVSMGRILGESMHCIFKSDFLALGVMPNLIPLVACFERLFAPTRELTCLLWFEQGGADV